MITRGIDQIRWLGSDLRRPECVLACASGSLYVSDWRGGVMQIRDDGRQHLLLATDNAELRPNGIALRPDGSFLLADLGEQGGLWHLHRDGRVDSFLAAIDGEPLPACNFVVQDRQQRVWFTVSTRQTPRHKALRRDIADGFIGVVHADGRARIVADNLAYTNELVLSQDARWLYVNETVGRRLTRFKVEDDASLSERTTLVEFGEGDFPDGLALDTEGGIWVTSIVNNRLYRCRPDGTAQRVIEDTEANHRDRMEQAFANDRMGAEDFTVVNSLMLKNISSLAFRGPARTDAVLGCLLGEQLATVELPVTGVEPAHWHWG